MGQRILELLNKLFSVEALLTGSTKLVLSYKSVIFGNLHSSGKWGVVLDKFMVMNNISYSSY